MTPGRPYQKTNDVGRLCKQLGKTHIYICSYERPLVVVVITGAAEEEVSEHQNLHREDWVDS